MNRLLKVYRWTNEHVRKKSRRDLHLHTVQRLQNVLGITSDIDYPEQLAYVATRSEQIASGLEWLRNDVVFRAAATLPSAVLFGFIMYRFVSQSSVAAVATGVTVYAIGATYAIQMLERWQDRTEALVLLYLEKKHVGAEGAHKRNSEPTS